MNWRADSASAMFPSQIETRAYNSIRARGMGVRRPVAISVSHEYVQYTYALHRRLSRIDFVGYVDFPIRPEEVAPNKCKGTWSG